MNRQVLSDLYDDIDDTQNRLIEVLVKLVHGEDEPVALAIWEELLELATNLKIETQRIRLAMEQKSGKGTETATH